MRYLLPLFCLPFAAQAETPVVVADIAPVHGLVARVMDGVGAPLLLMDGPGSAHGGNLRPAQAQALQDATLVIRVGDGIAPWLDGALPTLSGAALVVALMGEGEPGEHARGEHDDHSHGEDHGEDHADDHGDDHGEDHGDHAHGGDHSAHAHDPHGWLDPAQAADWLTPIADALAAQDPGHADLYRANAAQGRAEIDAAAQAVAARLDGGALVGAHDAWNHAAEAFGLTVLGAVADLNAQDAAPRRLAALRDAVAANGGACALAEDQGDADRLADLLEGTGARIAILDPLGSDIPRGPGYYPAFLARMGDVLADCLR